MGAVAFWAMWIFLLSTGPPSPPLNITLSNRQYERSNVSVLLQWDHPVDSGGTSVDNYTITVTGPVLQELISNGTTATIIVEYNEMYTVDIRARNCAGNSGRATASIFEGKGKLKLLLQNHIIWFWSNQQGKHCCLIFKSSSSTFKANTELLKQHSWLVSIPELTWEHKE